MLKKCKNITIPDFGGKSFHLQADRLRYIMCRIFKMGGKNEYTKASEFYKKSR